MVPHRLSSCNIDIHRACLGTGIAGDAGSLNSSDLENPEQVEDTLEGPIGTGIFAEGPFDKQGEEHDDAKQYKARDGNITPPKIEQRIVRVIILENKLA